MNGFSKFGEWVASYRNGYGRRPANGEGGPIVLRIADVSSGFIDLSSPRRGFVSRKDAATYRLVTDDLLFVRVNGAREIVGRCCRVGKQVPGDTIFNDHLIRVKLKPGLDSEFARFCMSMPSARIAIEEAAATSAGQLTISQQVLDAIQIPDLSLIDQRRIAARLKTQLGAVEQARQAAQTQVEDADVLRQAIYREAFAPIDDLRSVPLGEVADIQLGKMLSPKSKSGDRAAFPYLRNQNVQWDRFDLGNLASMEFSDREREKFKLRAGDLLVCEGGEPGRCAVWDGRLSGCYYQKALHRVRSRPDVAEPQFLALWIRHQSFVGAFADQKAKTTIAHLPLVRLQQLAVPDLSIAAQRNVVIVLKQRLAAAQQIGEAARARLADIEALPARLLARAFDPVRPELVEG